jgi:hypothetical protein
MSVEINLKEVERRANFAAFQDGLMEIFMGVITLTTGTIMFTRFLRKHPAAEGEVILDEG